MARTPAPILKQVRARVAAGEAFLDVIQPGWFDKIDTRKLDVEDDTQCVVGQLLGGFILDRLGLEDMPVSLLGFDGYSSWSNSDPTSQGITYDALTRRWKKVIKARQFAGV